MRKLPVVAVSSILAIQVALAPAALAATSPANPFIGTFTRTPGSGPAGTTIAIKSKTPCPKISGKPAAFIIIGVFTPAELDKASPTPTVASDPIVLPASGKWSAQLKVPATAKPGDYVIFPVCTDIKVTEKTLVLYNPLDFVVTPATTPSSSPSTTPSSSPTSSPSSSPTSSPSPSVTTSHSPEPTDDGDESPSPTATDDDDASPTPTPASTPTPTVTPAPATPAKAVSGNPSFTG